MITGITRVRNESLILADTLSHFLKVCQSVIVYDDASEDDTAEIAESFERVTVIRGLYWREDRPAEETRHRKLLLSEVKTPWTLCFDADERLVGEFPDLTADGYKFRLLDGYMTQAFQEPYVSGPLIDLPRMWGMEFRDILMLFRTNLALYKGLDRREPILHGKIMQAPVYVKHYGKCLSVEHWEETCEYYATHWPEPYKSKWAERRGRAIHEISDYGLALYPWDDLMKISDAWCRL